ncbi:MAG: cache domain-containing protein [Aestuariivita sp.]|nr:cache domain-containing protein [Aestuariivita sp.]
MGKLSAIFSLNYVQKLSLLATIPIILATASISVFVTYQSRAVAEQEIKALEIQLIEAKKAELKNYVTQAKNGFYFIYSEVLSDDLLAKEKVSQILSAMIYGSDGSFFVYDYDGQNLVNPLHLDMVGRTWTGLTDSTGKPVVDELIRLAREGSGYHQFLWEKPSTGKETQLIAYVVGLQDWRWVIGTGMFIDDILATVATQRAEVEMRVGRTFLYIGSITLIALLSVFFSGMMLNIRERRLADAKLKELSQRVFDAQEEERSRVARELHDGISQILVGIRYTLDNTRRRFHRGERDIEDSLSQGINNLGQAINEVRRISRDLRPGILDDLGLGPAIKSLMDDFSVRTGILTNFSSAVFHNRLDEESKIALYRIAQEALTNIERHSGANKVNVDLRGHTKGVTLRIVDNGRGIPNDRKSSNEGLGLRNMQERIEQLNGTLSISSSRSTTQQLGETVIEANLPLTHMLLADEHVVSEKVASA